MSRAADLFERLKAGRRTALEELIAERELESLFLDFKRSPADGASRQLAPEDNKNLSRSVSGFANSSGGVVVLGVDCRREETTGNEVAEKHALLDAGGFATKVQGAISRVTIPPHPGVQVSFFEEAPISTAGYVAVLIPQSYIGPLRSVVTNHYHIRSGSDFGIVPHDVLAGMFGRAPQPIVDLNVVSYPARFDGRPDHFTLAFGVFAVNLGAVVGERPYLSVAYGDVPAELIVVQIRDSQAFSLRRGLLPVVGVVASAGIVLPPGASEHVCDIIVDTPIDQPRGFTLECTLGVLGAPPRRYQMKTNDESVRAAMARARTGTVQTTDIVQMNPQS